MDMKTSAKRFIFQIARSLKDLIPACIKRKFKDWYFSSLDTGPGGVPLPTCIIIDSVNMCNLRCPLCPTGCGQLNYPKSKMSFDTFKTVVDKIPSLKNIDLFNWGEPFLNPDIFKMIRYAKERGIRVKIDTNFSLKKDEDFFVQIVESGLSLIQVSLDGVSEEAYSKYRVGGDRDLVIPNIKTLLEVKRRLGKATPAVTWKYVVNRFNEDEVQKARKMAHAMGIGFLTVFMNLSDDLVDFAMDDSIESRIKNWLPRNKKYVFGYYLSRHRGARAGEGCYRLFNEPVVNPDGKLSPCCVLTDQKNVFGDLMKESMKEIWNNEKYLYSRSLFMNKKYNGPAAETPCVKCNNFRKKRQPL